MLPLFFVGMGVQRFIIQPIFDSPAVMKIFVTVGLFIALQNLALMLFKADFRTIQTSHSMATIDIGNINVSVPRLVAFVLHLFTRRLVWHA